MTSCWLMQAGLIRLNELLKIKPSHKGGRSTCWGAGGNLGVAMIKTYHVYVWKCPKIKKNLLRKKGIARPGTIADSRVKSFTILDLTNKQTNKKPIYHYRFGQQIKHN